MFHTRLRSEVFLGVNSVSSSENIERLGDQSSNMCDRVAYRGVKIIRGLADLFFRERYGHRAVILESIAAVPGMVGGLLLHFKMIRHVRDDQGWIREMLDQAENERMHLMTFLEIAKPSIFDRILIVIAQLGFSVLYFFGYLLFPHTAHRFIAYLEDEAVTSYTHYLEEIDSGRHENGPAPQVAIDYWNMTEGSTLRDVVLLVREDEARHRDVNHGFSDCLSGVVEAYRPPRMMTVHHG